MHTTQRLLPSSGLRPGTRVFAFFASLRLTILLLSLFTACLAAATLLESRYDARIAQYLVYRTWWFALLLVLLAVNVLCAALKKYPWKRHQVGFLITHAGLLILLLGAVLTVLFGVEGQMVLIDTEHPALQARVGLTNRAEVIHLPDLHQIEVYRLQRHARQEMQSLLRLVERIDRGEEIPASDARGVVQQSTFTFSPGPFSWHSENESKSPLPWWLRFLHGLAAPWPETMADLAGGGTLRLDNFHPHAERHGDRFIPRDVPPGADAPAGLGPVVCCTLTRGQEKSSFQVGMSRRAARVLVGDDLYLVRYQSAVQQVGFAITLQRAHQIKGPGTDRPAWFQSDISVTGLSGERTREHSIVMNQPLAAGPYKVYQANYRLLIDPETQEPLLDGTRPVSLSGLTVACDPGLWLKYAGSLIVVLGIATMFYMKAYFFRPRSASPAAG